MNKLKCFITDDEEHAVDTIKKYVAQTPSLELVGVAFNGHSALDFLARNEVNLLFLDVQMPGLSGLDILKITKVPVILTTAYREYAADGYEHDVIDYLLKPVSYQRFLKAVQKAVTLLSKPAGPSPAALAGPGERDYLFVKGDRGIQVKINYSDIDYVEGAKNYVLFHCGKVKHITKMGLKDVEALLPQHSFARIHNSFIVAIRKITAFNGNEVVLNGPRLAESIKLPISQRLKARFIGKMDL